MFWFHMVDWSKYCRRVGYDRTFSCKWLWNFEMLAEEELGFSREVDKLCQLFLGRPNCIFELSQSTTKTLFGRKDCAAGKILKKQAKKQYIKRAYISRKFLVSVTKNEWLEKVQKGDPLSRQGVESLGRDVPPPEIRPCPFVLFWDNHFRLTNPRFFLKHLRPNCILWHPAPIAYGF